MVLRGGKNQDKTHIRNKCEIQYHVLELPAVKEKNFVLKE